MTSYFEEKNAHLVTNWKRRDAFGDTILKGRSLLVKLLENRADLCRIVDLNSSLKQILTYFYILSHFCETSSESELLAARAGLVVY